MRTGRANPLMVEGVLVEAYGVRTPLKQLSSITVPEPACLLIEPWDKSVVKEIERAIQEAKLGLTAVNEGAAVRVRVPPLSTETRSELIRTLHGKAEQFKQRLRVMRDRVREAVLKAEKAKALTQDDRYLAFAQLDDLTKEYTAKLKELADRKSQEIQTV